MSLLGFEFWLLNSAGLFRLPEFWSKVYMNNSVWTWNEEYFVSFLDFHDILILFVFGHTASYDVVFVSYGLFYIIMCIRIVQLTRICVILLVTFMIGMKDVF